MRGFTLIEIMVSVALFSVVMVVALGSLLSLSVAARKAEALSATMNNLGAAVDSMTRNVRTSYSYDCRRFNAPATSDCLTGKSVITVTNLDGKTITTYCLSQNGTGCLATATSLSCPAGASCSILRRQCDSTIVGDCVAKGFTRLTGKEVQVQYLSFIVKGSASSDKTQPMVNMFTAGSVQITDKQTVPFAIQTAVTQRIYDQ